MEPKSTLSATQLWIDHIDDLLSLLSEFTDRQIVAPDTPHDKEAAKVVAFKFVQAVRTLKATVVLSKAGDSSNAIILTRGLLENFIDAIFLMRNPQEVWRYLEEAADLESKMEVSRRKYNPHNEGPNLGTRPSSVQLRQQFQALADQHSTIRAWRKLNLRVRAERADHPHILALYEMIYPLTSAYAHGSSTILMEYLRQPIEGETGFYFSYAPKDAEVEVALTWAAMIFLGFLACMDMLMHIGLRKRLQPLEQRELQLISISQGVLSLNLGELREGLMNRATNIKRVVLLVLLTLATYSQSHRSSMALGAVRLIVSEASNTSRVLDTPEAPSQSPKTGQEAPPPPPPPPPPTPSPSGRDPIVLSAAEPKRTLAGVTIGDLKRLERYLPTGARIYTYPVNESTLAAALISADLDGDGKPETIVVYNDRKPTAEEGSLPLTLSVLVQQKSNLAVRSAVRLSGDVFFSPRIKGLGLPPSST